MKTTPYFSLASTFSNSISCSKLKNNLLRFLSAVILFFSFVGGSWGQNVTLTATGGTATGTFTTLKGAFDAINAGTHTGAIVISINANTTEGTTPATLNSSGAGSASYTSILINPTSDAVSVSGNPATGFGVIQLKGADNVTIDGDNPNTSGTNRNLTINNTNTATAIANSCIRIATAATNVTSADNIIIRNCNLNGNVTSGNSSSITSASGSSNSSFGIYCGGNGGTTAIDAPTAITSVTSQTAPSGTTINNLLITNNAINQCARAIVFNGAASTVSTGVTISNNLIGASATLTGAPPYSSPATTVYTKGIWINGTNAITISGNTLRNVMSFVPTPILAIELAGAIGSGTVSITGNTINGVYQNGNNTSKYGAILVSSAGGPFSVTNNTISNIDGFNTTTTSGSAGGVGIDVSTAATSALISGNNITKVYNRGSGYAARGIVINGGNIVTVQNNYISDILNIGSTSFSITYGAFGILANGGTGHKIYHNSVNLFGTNTGTGSNLTACFGILATTQTGIDVRNNIFSNTMTSSASSNANVCIYLPSGGTSSMNLTLNNNAYYTGTTSGVNGICHAGTSYTSPNTATAGLWTAANFSSSITTPSTNLRSYTSVLSSAGTNDNASFAATSAVPFTSSTNLKINTSASGVSSLFLTGASGTGVTTDIENDTRATNPCIGADEFALPVSCTTPTSPIDGATNVSLTTSFTWAAATNATSYDVYLGTDNPPTNVVNGTNFTSATFTPANALAGSTTYYWRIVPKNAGSTASGCSVWSFTTQAATPTITASNLGTFSDRCINTTSTANSFNISGIYLTTDDITVGPLTGFAFSSTSNGTYTSTLTISQPGGTLASTPIFVQFTPTAVGSFNGNIPITGGGLSAALNVSAVGTGINTPATSSTGISSALTSSSVTLAGSYVANCQTISAYGIEYSTTSGFANGSGTSVTSSNQSAGSYTLDLSSLNPGTTYFYKSYATYGSTTVWGTQSSFTTTALEFTSAATGAWNSTSTWTGGIVPVCGSNVTIQAGHNVTVNSSSNVSRNLTIASGGTLTVASGDLTVGCTLNNTPLTNNGTLTVTGGTLNVNGNITSALGSIFNQSGGNINIDGNNGGSTTGSVASGTPLLNLLQLNSGINLTGGTLTIVDPHTASTNTNGYAIFYSNSTTGNNYPSANHTMQFGNSISTDPGGHTSGFYINQWSSNAFLPFGSCVVNGPSGVNRGLNFFYTPMHIQGNITVNNGGLLNGVATFFVGGNILVNSGGSLINTGTVVTGTLTSNTSTSTTPAAVSTAQTIGGSGTFQNLASNSTANLTSLTINNNSSAGVTISAPLSISGTLTMTAGKINTTATNLLTLGTTSAAGTLTYTAGQIAGPFARTFATSSSTTAVYDATTLFPVGDGTNYIPIHIDPINGGGVVQMRGQAFNTNTGTAGTGVASVLSTDRWEALVTSGTITDCFIGLNDAQIASGNVIAQSSSANGTYNAVSGASTFVSVTPNALRTATAIPNASYSGYFTYAAPGPAISSFSPASVCPGTVATITITGTNLASATSVTLNGEACTITANTATSITVTTDATPQAGNIVVTTAANSVTSASALSLFTLPTVTASSDASNNTVCSGTGVTLNGGGATSYVWNNGVSNGISFTPTSTSTYTVTGTDGNGCVNTANITITVNNAVSISSQPINEVVLPNANASFSVTASGTGLTYQWELSTNSGSSWNAISNGGIYTGATTNTLTLTGVTTETGNQYRCVVSGTAPCGPVTSSAATLTISSTAISAQPTNQSICESSGSASFSVSTTGNAPSSIQWQVSTDGGSNWSNLTGETNTTLSLTGLTTSSNGYQYQCVINGNVTSNAAALTVSVPSVAGSVSADQGICSGATPSSITLTGNTGTIQWQSSTDNSTFSNISGATSSTLAASTIGALNSTRYYRATVTNGGCSAATSALVTVTVTPAPNAGTLSGTQTICANATTTFTSNGDTGGAWTSANTAIATANISSGVVTGVAAGTTTITYTITGTGGCSNATATRTVTVNAIPPITSATATPATICAGGTVSLSAASVSASSGTAVIGSGNTQGANNTTFVRVGNSVGNQFKNQYLFTAAELNAAGLTSGNITSLAFDVFVSGGGTVSNLTFKLGTTTLTSLTSSYVAGLTEVYTIATYPASGVLQVGVQTVNFTTPFNWDGTSNLVLEACSQLATSGTAGDLRSSTTSFVSTITNNPSTTACGSSTGAGTVSVRPNFTFGGQVGTNNAANFSWSWDSTPSVSAATGTTTAVNNTSTAINQTYTVTATNATTGCTNTATTSAITVNTVPATPSANNTSICGPQNATCSVTGSGTVGNTFKWYTTPTGGTNISGQTGASLSAYPVSSNTTFYVSEANTNCESARIDVVQTVTTPPSVTASASSSSICAGQSTTLSATSSNSGYTYSWNNNGGSGASVTVSPSATTTYTVTGTDASGGASNGCSTTATATVTVNPLPTNVSISPSTASICNSVGSAQSMVLSGGLEVVYENGFESGVTGFTPSANATATSNVSFYSGGTKSVLFNTSTTSATQSLTMENNIDLTNASNVQITFTHIAAMEGAVTSYDYGLIQYSSDGGTNWSTFLPADYVGSASTSPFNSNVRFTTRSYSDWISALTSTSSLPTNSLWKTEKLNVPTAALTSQFKIRFRYSTDSGTFYYGWLIDDILITKASSTTWSPTTALYTDAAATVAYAGASASTVYAQPTTNTTYTATATSAAGCTSSNTATITVNQPTITWTGATSTDPTVASNWNPVALPCTVSDITIPSGLTNYPTYTSLTISSGGSYTLQAGAQLTVTGALTNNGTMTIESGATFKQGTSVAGTGTYNVKQAIDNGAGSGTTLTGRFWYLGSPLACTRSSSFGTAGSLNKVWEFTNGAYANVGDAASLNPTKGYVHRRSDASTTLTFSGQNLYAQDVTLSLSNNAGTYGGWHLISNPYTAYLDWNQIVSNSTGMSNTYYIRSYNSNNQDVDALISYNAANGLESNTSSFALGNTGSTTAQYIAPLQAFWVKVPPTSILSSSAGQLNLQRAFTSHQTGNVGLKNTGVYPVLAKVNLYNGAKYDQALVYMNEFMTNAFDQNDSEKMFVSGVASVYTMASGKKLVMNGIKNNKKKISVPLYLELPTSKVYQLQLSDYIMEDGLILLEDKQEGTIQDFTIHDTYAFYANSGMLSNRFVLHFFMPDAGVSAQGPSNSWVEEESVINEGGSILVSSNGRGKVTITQDIDASVAEKGSVVVRDAAGREIYNGQLTGSATHLELDAPSGIYFVSVELNGQVEVKKIFVQQ